MKQRLIGLLIAVVFSLSMAWAKGQSNIKLTKEGQAFLMKLSPTDMIIHEYKNKAKGIHRILWRREDESYSSYSDYYLTDLANNLRTLYIDRMRSFDGPFTPDGDGFIMDEDGFIMFEADFAYGRTFIDFELEHFVIGDYRVEGTALWTTEKILFISKSKGLDAGCLPGDYPNRSKTKFDLLHPVILANGTLGSIRATYDWNLNKLKEDNYISVGGNGRGTIIYPLFCKNLSEDELKAIRRNSDFSFWESDDQNLHQKLHWTDRYQKLDSLESVETLKVGEVPNIQEMLRDLAWEEFPPKPRDLDGYNRTSLVLTPEEKKSIQETQSSLSYYDSDAYKQELYQDSINNELFTAWKTEYLTDRDTIFYSAYYDYYGTPKEIYWKRKLKTKQTGQPHQNLRIDLRYSVFIAALNIRFLTDSLSLCDLIIAKAIFLSTLRFCGAYSRLARQ